MFRDVVSPEDSLQDWQSRLRPRILERVTRTMGKPPQGLKGNPSFKTEDAERVCGLESKKISFEAIPGFVTEGRLLLPRNAKEGARPGALCIHGTDFELAHLNVMSPESKPNRNYAVELAKRGFAALSVDQLCFKAGGSQGSHDDAVKEFYSKYPEWSLDGARLFVHQRALDALASLDFVDPSTLSCIGNSLGGRAALYLTCLDERVKAGVASTGLSANLTNLFRNLPGPKSLSPALDKGFIASGRPAFEYQEIVALAAPRLLLLLEPWNDPCNPMVESTLRCFEKARFVYQLFGSQDNFQLVCHGDGHDTRPPLRDYAYALMERALS